MNDPRVLVDAATRDDAAVFQVAPDRALVATVDFFAPIVDDPRDFGRIAAANALSDIYAMGATPLFALNLVAWPRDPVVMPLLAAVLEGGAAIANEAGCLLLGGHSIDDAEPKYGMVAVGDAHPDSIVTNAGARPGDSLVLTKPIGTGVLATALKRDLIGEDAMAAAITSMTTLNRGAADAMREAGRAVHAATDVTGFGLLGHLGNMLTASGAAAELDASAVPLLEGAREAVGKGAVPGGTKRNLDTAMETVTFDDGITDDMKLLLADAQTSGGLLISVAPEGVEDLLAGLATHRTPATAVIGRVTAGVPGTIRVATGA